MKFIALITCIPSTPSYSSYTDEVISGLFLLAGVGIAAALAYRYAIKQKRHEVYIGVTQQKYQRKLHALEGCWKLLAYTTDTENSKSVLVWEQPKNSDRVYSIQTENAKQFLTNLSSFFYETGLGIYLTPEIKALLFEYRSTIWGFLLRERENEQTLIQVQNPKMVARMIEIHQQLVLMLKQQTEVLDKLA